ncbi:hypothetical protein BHK69_07240 [Bosea vaviloviae]|uniref:Uncharacterized protein n=1 Tax=Bosea vaviloviae TaxID=1526658 RepID=A0A1D7TYU7_9HYPH|nr:hypothetical protein BHK69_07240 [Bosea vaviloviae]
MAACNVGPKPSRFTRASIASAVVVPSAKARLSVSLVTEILMSETPGSFSSAARMVEAQLPQSMPSTFQVTDFDCDSSPLRASAGSVIRDLLDQ